jgi:hypothetical protein
MPETFENHPLLPHFCVRLKFSMKIELSVKRVLFSGPGIRPIGYADLLGRLPEGVGQDAS